MPGYILTPVIEHVALGDEVEIYSQWICDLKLCSLQCLQAPVLLHSAASAMQS